MIKLPEGVRASLSLYLKIEQGDETLDSVITLSGFTGIPIIEGPLDAAKIAAALNFDLPFSPDKARMMTAAEIAEYHREEESEDA